MKSMTAYGCSEHRDEAVQLTVEVKSYNNRFLELSFYLPSWLGALEPRLREYLGRWVARGKVEVSIRIVEAKDPGEISVDEGLARSYMAALERLRAICGSSEAVGLGHLVDLEGIFRTRRERDVEGYGALIMETLARALEGFEAARSREGTRTQEDILENLGRIGREVEMIAARAPEMREAVIENLRSRFREVAGSEYDEGRVMTEAALLLVKFDVNEEMQRLRSHLASFERIAAAEGPCGKRLDFICQELNREVNTLGSKNSLIEVDSSIIVMKDCVEKIREQLRNVE